MPKWVEMLNRHLADGTPSVQIIGFFGHTGNFLADSPSNNLEEVTARFCRLLETDCVVRPIDDVQANLTALADARKPEAQDGIRWTLGLAFHGRAGIDCRSILTTPRAILWRISPCTIGAWKRDNLGDDETLDRQRRGGGWGKISDVEAVTSHGPIGLKRHNELKALFGSAQAGLVFVTAFLTRRAMTKYLAEIAWETEVWVAETPSHIIHFNGERFLGPYE